MDLRSLAPLDRECVLASVVKTGRALVVHEAHLTSGIGGEVAVHHYRARVGISRRSREALGSLDVPIPFSPTLEDAVLPVAARRS